MKRKFVAAALLLALLLAGMAAGCSIIELYTVSYSVGSGGGGTAPSSTTVEDGTSIFLPDQGSMTPSGFTTFGGWSSGGSTHQAGAVYIVTDNVTFTGIWNAGECKINVMHNEPSVSSYSITKIIIYNYDSSAGNKRGSVVQTASNLDIKYSNTWTGGSIKAAGRYVLEVYIAGTSDAKEFTVANSDAGKSITINLASDGWDL